MGRGYRPGNDVGGCCSSLVGRYMAGANIDRFRLKDRHVL